MLVLTFKSFDIFSLSPISQFFLHPLVHRCWEFSRLIKQYAIRKNDLSNKEKMLQKNRQMLRKKCIEQMTLLSHFEVSHVHAKQCIGRTANQYSCLTYTKWTEALYTGMGRTAILLSLHERNYNGTMAKYAFRCVTHSV